MTIYPKIQQVLDTFGAYTCHVVSVVLGDSNASDRPPRMEFIFRISLNDLTSGFIEMFLPLTERERFERDVWAEVFYGQELRSNALPLEDEEDTLGSEPLWWFTFESNYGPRDMTEFQ